MKRGDIKKNRVMASKPSQNKTFKELGEEFLRDSEVRRLNPMKKNHKNNFII